MNKIVIGINKYKGLVVPNHPVMMSERDNNAHIHLGYYFITCCKVNNDL